MSCYGSFKPDNSKVREAPFSLEPNDDGPDNPWQRRPDERHWIPKVGVRASFAPDRTKIHGAPFALETTEAWKRQLDDRHWIPKVGVRGSFAPDKTKIKEAPYGLDPDDDPIPARKSDRAAAKAAKEAAKAAKEAAKSLAASRSEGQLRRSPTPSLNRSGSEVFCPNCSQKLAKC
eukprot:gnl/TRDRNA2_/TRDRNA2_135495_c0_seq1.p1 gnl/TRDRNA2_/TRDRNA2_135495_c0~~gnl/TRDRNA2_/TRDRNA2_135495_c0_seq1.p1  ORF type:complete len:200 (+),score=32.04 gnl/TRDRNA2_/TRDRNA2_135495_c0_seq1:76-600(+)